MGCEQTINKLFTSNRSAAVPQGGTKRNANVEIGMYAERRRTTGNVVACVDCCYDSRAVSAVTDAREGGGEQKARPPQAELSAIHDAMQLSPQKLRERCMKPINNNSQIVPVQQQ